jgi:hypothetical protein
MYEFSHSLDPKIGIDRWPTDGAVEGSQPLPQFTKLNKPIDRPQDVVGRNMRLQRELIEQSSLVDLPMSHHDLQSCISQQLNQQISFQATEDFFNKIDPQRTLGIINLT